MPHHSLAVAPPARKERRAAGRAARRAVPRSAHAQWTPNPSRPDPVEWLRATNAGRLPDFVAIRVGRMVASPFAFLRGAADLMAIDLQQTPTTGLITTAIGDAHLANFGFYASPERQLVMDVNDFDQAQPGPWEWDLKRLAASIVVAGRGNGLSDTETRASVHASVGGYVSAMANAAKAGVMAFHIGIFTVDDLRQLLRRTSLRKEIALAEQKARGRTQEAAIPRFAEPAGDGRFRIIDEPPLLVDVTPDTAEATGTTQEEITAALDDYVATLPYEWQRVLQAYSVMDVAYRVTGVGSAALRTYLVLLTGDGAADFLFLQMKECAPSVLAGRVAAPTSRYAHNGERVVRYQQRSQTVSDPLIGWTTIRGRHFYVRQLRDMKGAIPIEDLDAEELPVYSALCGALLARAHARAGDPVAMAGYLGKGGSLGEAVADFAVAYADQTERDWSTARDAALAGHLPHVPDQR